MSHRITPPATQYGVYEKGGLFWWQCFCHDMMGGPFMTYTGALQSLEAHQNYYQVPRR